METLLEAIKQLEEKQIKAKPIESQQTIKLEIKPIQKFISIVVIYLH